MLSVVKESATVGSVMQRNITLVNDDAGNYHRHNAEAEEQNYAKGGAGMCHSVTGDAGKCHSAKGDARKCHSAKGCA